MSTWTATGCATRRDAFPRPPFPDPVFDAWAERSLVWLPDRGMGYLPSPTIEYDSDYWAKYEAYAKTLLGKRLTMGRIDMVERHIKTYRDSTLIDIGIGCGDFIERARMTWHGTMLNQMQVFGYDVSRPACEWLTDRGLYRDPYHQSFEIATFWDSLEHILDAERLLANVTARVFAVLPIVPGDGPPPRGWKHVRPGEHYWYFTRDGFIAWMRERGFVCLEHNTNETLAGREDISGFAFRRVE